jgi:hypothetical protein
MNNEESTIYGTAEEQPKNNQQEKNAGKGWQQVTIGGVTGILMGAAATYAVNALAGETANNDEPDNTTTDGTQSHVGTNGLHVAEVDQNLSFGEAFAAARAEVGPGGVFHWHGNIYNTYTAQEWNSMTDGEHQQFAQQVQPEIQPGEGHSTQHHTTNNDVAQHTHHNDDNNHRGGHNDDNNHRGGHNDDNNHRGEHHDDPHPPTPKPTLPDEPEVHFLGIQRVEREDGSAINVGHKIEDDHDVLLIDVDDDRVFDVRVDDRNNNGEVDRGEMSHITSEHQTVEEFAQRTAEQNNGLTAYEDVVSAQQDHIADDMPDYMPDADVQTA